MCRRKRADRQRRELLREKNERNFQTLIELLVPTGKLFSKATFHGNIKWAPEQIAQQAIIWAWQETNNVTDAFDISLGICEKLGIDKTAQTYTRFINALSRYRHIFSAELRKHYQSLAEQIGGRFWRNDGWVLMGFDGSRGLAPRSESNEKEFCAPNYGNGHTAKHRKKKTKGMRRRKNERNKPHPPAPQPWITLFWHMTLRLPWTWRIGPSNSSERGHAMEILETEKFPKNTLFCGDAGFVGFNLWNAILCAGGQFLVRVGGNVKLLSEHADVKKLGDGLVLCWPKDKMRSGVKPLRLRLVKVKIRKTTMWILTSVLDRKKLPKKKIIKFYMMRWGVEVEFRGLKQTLVKAKLRCRNGDRLYAELDWSIRAMAFAELISLREQIRNKDNGHSPNRLEYDTKNRSLANTMRALRKCMRHLNPDPDTSLLSDLASAQVQKYKHGTDKRARCRPPNPDKKPLGEPTVTNMSPEERERFRSITERIAG